MKIQNIISKMSLVALMSAFVFVGTVFISIPYAGGAGYFNISDGLILFASIYFGPLVGIGSAIIGCSLGDLYSGYATSIPFTIVAKTLEAIAAFLIFKFLGKTKYLKYALLFLAPLLMVTSYIPYYLIFDDGKGALALISSLYDLLQGLTGSIICISLLQLFYRVNLPFKAKFNNTK